ncbi:MAG: hydrolase TatD [Candidatus Reconcilbacillus cellulovorans]|uniref:Hydrolase TatD n=1 Tax=Candidatus Reconcilbacillus cellulovorans TaxID=1906605 RepID=A0A2A6E296_9BACL|nr:MAG: hydrolase TatD [Candidatus Reconcilbacillus cellulovorans]
MLTDTHAHLSSPRFDDDRDDALRRAREAGVTRIIDVGFNRRSIAASLALAEREPDVWAAVGWHPTDAVEMEPDDLDRLAEWCRHPKVVAIGEIGLDYYWKNVSPDVQRRAFREQIRLARRVGKPIVIHNRDAHGDVVAILREERADEIGGVMHCFSGDAHFAAECLALGFYLSFGGPITFKSNGALREVLARVPKDRLLLETDSPYLAPHPHRGRRNEPAYVRLVAETAASVLGMEPDELAAVTTENAKKLFILS